MLKTDTDAYYWYWIVLNLTYRLMSSNGQILILDHRVQNNPIILKLQKKPSAPPGNQQKGWEGWGEPTYPGWVSLFGCAAGVSSLGYYHGYKPYEVAELTPMTMVTNSYELGMHIQVQYDGSLETMALSLDEPTNPWFYYHQRNLYANDGFSMRRILCIVEFPIHRAWKVISSTVDPSASPSPSCHCYTSRDKYPMVGQRRIDWPIAFSGPDRSKFEAGAFALPCSQLWLTI